MFEFLTKPILGTPHIPALKLGMSLSVMTLMPGLSEVLFGLLVSLWGVYIATKAGLTFVQHGHHSDVTSQKSAG